MPVRALIRRVVEPTVRCAQQQMLWLARKRRERPRIAARRTHNGPRALRLQADRAEQQGNQKKNFGRDPKMAPMISNTLQTAHSDLKLPT